MLSMLFFASSCDYLVSNDSKMRDKARLTYHTFGISTRVIDLVEFFDELGHIEKFHQQTIDDPVGVIFKTLDENPIITSKDEEGEDSYEVVEFNYPYLEYFNQVYRLEDKTNERIVLILRRVTDVLKEFTFYTEEIKLLNYLFGIYGQPDDYEEIISQLIHKEGLNSFSWASDSYEIIVFRESEVWRFSLQLARKT